MEPLTLLTAALIAGHGALEDAGKDAYTSLKAMVRKLFIGDDKGERALADYDEEPETYETPLKKALERNKVHENEEAVRLAARVMEARDPSGAARNKYRVTVLGSQGVQVGNNNVQTNTWN
jgi:hypothetical protein